MKVTIEKFIKDKNVAVVGVSRDPRKWGSGLAPSSGQSYPGVEGMLGHGVKRVWLYKGAGGEGASSPEAVEAARRAGLCPMMFFPPTGVHRIHFLFRKWRRKLPPEFSA